MAVSAGKIEYEIGANKKGLDKGLKSAMGSIKGFVAKAAILGGVFKFFKSGISAASDYGEAQSSLNKLIGKDGTKALEDFAKTSSKTAGINKAETLEMANNFAGLFQSIPKGAIDSGKALVGLEQRVADLGSQFNRSNEEISTGLQSALAGRLSMTLQQMGIDLSMTAMQTSMASGAFAQMGYDASTSFQSLDSGTQVLLRYQAFMDKTKGSAGDFAQTLGFSLPNQLKKMKAEFKNSAMSLTKQWLPTITKVVSMLANMGEWIGKNKALVIGLAGAFAGFKLGGFVYKIGKAVAGFVALATAKAGAEGGIFGLITAGTVLAGLGAMIGGIAGGMFFGGGSGGGSSAPVPKSTPLHITVTTSADGQFAAGTSNGSNVNVQANVGKGTI